MDNKNKITMKHSALLLLLGAILLTSSSRNMPIL
jgi:hypothetical protein